MIEKRQEIGTPVQCAEATTNETFNILEMEPSPKYLCTDIKGVDFYAPNGKHFRVKGNNMYWVYGRICTRAKNLRQRACNRIS